MVVYWFWVGILFQGSVALDSWMGTVHGICPTLVMRKFDGVDVLSRLWMVFLGGDVEGKRKLQGTYY